MRGIFEASRASGVPACWFLLVVVVIEPGLAVIISSVLEFTGLAWVLVVPANRHHDLRGSVATGEAPIIVT